MRIKPAGIVDLPLVHQPAVNRNIVLPVGGCYGFIPKGPGPDHPVVLFIAHRQVEHVLAGILVGTRVVLPVYLGVRSVGGCLSRTGRVGIVVNTPFRTDRVVVKQRCGCRQTLGDKVQILVQGEVGVQLRGTRLPDTDIIYNGQRVHRVVAPFGIAPPAPVRIHGQEKVGRKPVCRTPHPRVSTAGTAFIVVVGVLLAVKTRQVDLELGRIGQLNVNIAAEIETVKIVVGLITLAVVVILELVAFVQVSQRTEVLHRLAPPTGTQGHPVRHGQILVHLLLPVDIRVNQGIFRSLRCLEPADKLIRNIRIPGGLIHHAFPFDDLVLDHHRIVGIQLIRLLRQ